MAKFRVTVLYKGNVDIVVEAENEKEAQAAAVDEFENVSEMEIIANIADVSTNCFCVTEVENEEDD